jgi:hypothetical protein
MSRSGRPALRLRGCGGPGPLGVAANIVLTDNRIIRLRDGYTTAIRAFNLTSSYLPK